MPTIDSSGRYLRRLLRESHDGEQKKQLPAEHSVHTQTRRRIPDKMNPFRNCLASLRSSSMQPKYTKRASRIPKKSSTVRCGGRASIYQDVATSFAEMTVRRI